MDLNLITVGSGEAWTEEQHASFLNWMEESFVKRMLERTKDGGRQRRPRLDRHIPDSATESTSDFRRAGAGASRKRGANCPTRAAAAAAAADPETANLAVRNRNMQRKLSPPRYDASEDQVVPQV